MTHEVSLSTFNWNSFLNIMPFTFWALLWLVTDCKLFHLWQSCLFTQDSGPFTFREGVCLLWCHPSLSGPTASGPPLLPIGLLRSERWTEMRTHLKDWDAVLGYWLSTLRDDLIKGVKLFISRQWESWARGHPKVLITSTLSIIWAGNAPRQQGKDFCLINTLWFLTHYIHRIDSQGFKARSQL